MEFYVHLQKNKMETLVRTNTKKVQMVRNVPPAKKNLFKEKTDNFEIPQDCISVDEFFYKLELLVLEKGGKL